MTTENSERRKVKIWVVMSVDRLLFLAVIMVGGSVREKNSNFEYLDWHKMHFLAWSNDFYEPLFRKFGLSVWALILIHH